MAVEATILRDSTRATSYPSVNKPIAGWKSLYGVSSVTVAR